MFILLFPLILLSLTCECLAFTTQAKNAIVIDHKTGIVLFEHNAHDHIHPSSMSKMMTLYVAFTFLRDGVIKDDSLFTVSTEAWKRGGSSMFLKQGQKVSVKDLIKGISVVSGNDASIVIAEGISGTQESFALEMNKFASKIGLKESYFLNSTGWPQEGHYMSVHDIAIMSRKLFTDFADRYEVFSLPYLEYNGIKQDNTNKLVLNADSDVKIDGVKTGHSEVAGYGVAVSAQNNLGNRIFVVVSGIDSSKKRFSEAQNLVNYIFDNFKLKTLYKKGESIEYANVRYGKDKKVHVISDEDVNVIYNVNDENYIKHFVKYDTELIAPIKKGTKIGKLIVTVNEVEIQSFDVYSAKDVKELTFLKRMLYKIFSIENTKK